MAKKKKRSNTYYNPKKTQSMEFRIFFSTKLVILIFPAIKEHVNVLAEQ